MNNINVLAIIPAKTDSTRLKKKNLRIIDGKTLVEHSIDYALSSELVKDIIVTQYGSGYTSTPDVLVSPPEDTENGECAMAVILLTENNF